MQRDGIQAELEKPTPDDVKILLTNNFRSHLSDLVKMYSLRWKIEQFFKELKSTLSFDQYRFQMFECPNAWNDLVW